MSKVRQMARRSINNVTNNMDDKIFNINNAFNSANVKCDVWIKIKFPVEYSTCPVEDSTSRI